MRIDWYTKGVLTIIAVLLGVIALRPYVSPDAVAHAQGSFTGVQYSGPSNVYSFFDPRTGEVYAYFSDAGPTAHFRLTKLGAPPVTVK